MELDCDRKVETMVTEVQDMPAPKGRKTWIILAVILLIVAALVVGGMYGYQYITANDDVLSGEDDTKSQEAENDPDDDTTSGKDEDPAEPSEDIELVVRQAELVYELTDAHMREFSELLLATEEKAMQGTATEADFDTLEEKFAYLEEQFSVAMILYYCNLTDEAASERYLECSEKVTQANNDYLQMLRKIYLSNASVKDTLFENWTAEELSMLTAYSEEIMRLNQRNSELEVAYQALQDSDDLYTEMVPLYMEMVQNNNRIAEIYGYDNYYDLAYSQVYNRDYGSDEIQLLREYVSEYIPETLESVFYSVTADISQLNPFESAKLADYLYESYNETHLTGYLKSLPEQIRSKMLDMFDGNILLPDKDSGWLEGAFTTNLGDDRLICYFGPGYSSTFTMIHELGHYYGGQHLSLIDIPLDLAETQSQGNEWLFMSYLSNEMSPDLHRTIAKYQAHNALATILVSVIIDEFEERVYTHPDVESLTSFDLDMIMQDVCRAYGGISFLNSTVADIQYYWRLVVVEQPVYYISYGVSGLSAMSLYTKGLEDYLSAVESFRILCEESMLEQGFLGNIQQAALLSPFEEDIYIDLLESYCE